MAKVVLATVDSAPSIDAALNMTITYRWTAIASGSAIDPVRARSTITVPVGLDKDENKAAIKAALAADVQALARSELDRDNLTIGPQHIYLYPSDVIG